jgi:hypothetical protein
MMNKALSPKQQCRKTSDHSELVSASSIPKKDKRHHNDMMKATQLSISGKAILPENRKGHTKT